MSEYCSKHSPDGISYLFANCPYCHIEQLTARVALLERELEEYKKLEQPGSVHVNILAGKLKLSREEALHIAGATDYDHIKDENQQLELELTETTAALKKQLQNYSDIVAENERLREENTAIADCLSGSRKAKYTAEMYDAAIDAARQDAARIAEDGYFDIAVGPNDEVCDAVELTRATIAAAIRGY